MSGRSRSSKRRRVYRDRHGRKLRTLSEEDRFGFVCDQCGRCCSKSTIPLSPYDILNISDYYSITPREFLEDFTVWAPAAESGIPVVLLKTEPRCPFSRDRLCTVYDARPFLCRSYPVVRIITHNPSIKEIGVKYSLVKNCSDIKTDETQTIREWLLDQCGEIYLRESHRWSEFIVRLAGSEYPRDDKVFHRIFYGVVYTLEACEDELRAVDISESSSPEEKFDAMIRFASNLDWSRVTKEERADGALFYIKHGEEIRRRRERT